MSCSPTDHWSVAAPWVFRDTDYKVSADVRDDTLVVQVEDCLAADQWTGQFDAKHIEELTRKTGNFKQFPIFLNMLESAITKSSDSVTLDLLTYADLESLRNKKHGSGRGLSPSNTPSQSKRYLILTYSVEFDRIHYPLALPYSGRPDPAHLQRTIRQLHTELERAKKQASRNHKHADLARLRKEYDALSREKDALEEALETFKQDVMLTRNGAVSKEMRILKKVVKNLEEELLKEKSKHQKYVSKKNEELKTLLQELEEVKLSERTLRTRVKSLTNELAVLKHGLRTSPATFCSTKKRSQKKTRRSTSTDRRPNRTSLSSERTRPSIGRTPSPSGARLPRFDPTAYIVSKKKKQQDADTSLGRLKVSVRSRPPRSNSRDSLERSGGGRFRSNSRDSSRASSRRSSVASNHSNDSGRVQRNMSSGGKRRKLAWESPQFGPTPPGSGHRRTSGTHNNSSLLDHSAEISEIDARLNALQEFMKRSLDTTKNYTNKR